MNEDVKQYNEIFYGTNYRAYADQLVRGASGNALNAGSLEAASGTPVGTFFATGQGMREHLSLKNETLSFFGTVDFELTEDLTLTGGLALNRTGIVGGPNS
jgi:hypothetical protein